MNDKHLHTPHDPKGKHLATMMMGAVGVVYCDIGTSPLYTMREAFHPSHGLDFNQTNILGVLSLLLWSLIMVVSVKYIMLILRADNKGEGGIFALIALAERAMKRKSMFIVCIGLLGAALFYGDGIITPAISVLSAVEGLKTAAPNLEKFIVPVSCVILVFLFAGQQTGTDKIGKLFGPITMVWFLSLGVLGISNIIQNPVVLQAFSPYYAFKIFAENHITGFLLLGTVVLAVTGVEALYADMGHYGKKPIRYAWLYFVMPCLMLNYLGQGALILRSPDAIKDPFYLMVPEWGLYPMIALATAATVIASQAMISGAYSLTQQAILLGFTPRLKIEHTSDRHKGQIYMPSLNKAIFIGVILLVIWFRNSSNLAAAYGIAVTGTMLMTTMLIAIVSYKLWNWSLPKVCLIVLPLFIIDFSFFTATLTKLSHGIGAWIPLIMGLGVFTLMLTWYEGRAIKNKRMAHSRERIDTFIKHISARNTKRVSGTAIYMARDIDHVPLALALNYKHNKSLHERMVLIRVDTLDIPRVPEADRLHVEELDKGFVRIVISYGFMQQPSVPRALSHLEELGVDIDAREATYVMNRERIVATPGGGMWLWRERLYSLMHRNAAEASDFYHLPASRVLEIGSPVNI